MGRHETAVEFLTDLEERLEVAQVQREVYHAVIGKMGKNPQGENAAHLTRLENELLNITQVIILHTELTNHYAHYIHHS